MVKGISKQVIVLQAPQTQMFEQAIFILKDDATTISDRDLLKEAQNIIKSAAPENHNRRFIGPVWAFAGAMATGAIWLLSQILR